MLFKINTKPEADHVFNSVEYMNIYNYLKKGKSHLKIRKLINYPNTYNESLRVSAEIQRIENEVISKMSGRFKIGEETINDITKDIYYKATTKTDLINSITSFLDVETVLNDIIIYYDIFDKDRTWSSFKGCFNEGINN